MSSEPLKHVEQLLIPFEESYKPPEAFLVGTEAERFGVRADLSPVPFDGPDGVSAVLAALAARFGWEPAREHAEGQVISLRRDGASITLEPAAQLELSGAPFRTVHETSDEFARHRQELFEVCGPLGITWLNLGFHPFAAHDELPHVPKLRYRIMRAYLPTRGPRSLDMMRRTATVQANLDYCDAGDAMRKLRVALALQPVVTALCANSPWREGRSHGLLSERADTWLHMDPDRSGLLPFAWHTDATLADYVQWALDVPMFAIKRGGQLVENTGQSFRAFMRDGFGGATAELSDWDTHLNALFPEARLKRTLEVRGADAQPQEAVCAVPALWKGLLYDGAALAGAEVLIGGLDAATVQTARPEIARRALNAELAGKPLWAWAERMVELATQGLARIGDLDAQGQDETRFLDPLRTRLQTHETPAETLLKAIEGAPDPRAALVEVARLRA